MGSLLYFRCVGETICRGRPAIGSSGLLETDREALVAGEESAL
jgi:hypothetical protein